MMNFLKMIKKKKTTQTKPKKFLKISPCKRAEIDTFKKLTF